MPDQPTQTAPKIERRAIITFDDDGAPAIVIDENPTASVEALRKHAQKRAYDRLGVMTRGTARGFVVTVEQREVTPWIEVSA